MTKSIKSSEQLLRGQLGKIHTALLLSMVPNDFHNRILRNHDSTKRLIKLLFEYIEKEAKHCLELLGSSKKFLSSENKCILVTVTEWHELSPCVISRKIWYRTYILYAHKILKEGYSKVAIYSPSGDTDISYLTLAHLYEYKERIYIVNSHGQYQKHKTKQYYLRRWNH